MPLAGDLENAGLIHGGGRLASTIRLVETGPMSLCVKAGMIRLPEFTEPFELKEDVTIDVSAYPDATYPVSVVMDLVLHGGEVKVLVDRVVKDGAECEWAPGGRMFGARQHPEFEHFPHPTEPASEGEYRYVRRTGGSVELLEEHEDKRHIARLVRPGWFVFGPAAKELPTISHLKVVADLDLVRRNRHARRAAAGKPGS